jgi:hypothetical protein
MLDRSTCLGFPDRRPKVGRLLTISVDANSGADHQKCSEKVHDDTESGADYQKGFNFQRSNVAVIE